MSSSGNRHERERLLVAAFTHIYGPKHSSHKLNSERLKPMIRGFANMQYGQHIGLRCGVGACIGSGLPSFGGRPADYQPGGGYKHVGLRWFLGLPLQCTERRVVSKRVFENVSCTRTGLFQHLPAQTISRTPPFDQHFSGADDIAQQSSTPAQTISRTSPLIARVQHPRADDIAHPPFDCSSPAPPPRRRYRAPPPFECKGPAPPPPPRADDTL